jgi:hypothetical protein
MSLAPIGGYSPSPYEIGGADLTQAQKDINELNALKVTQNDYKDANATHGWGGIFNGFSDKSDKQALIKKQIQLEDDASKHLFNIAASNERGQVSATLLAHAQSLGSTLQERLWQDEKNAFAGDPSGNGSLTQQAYERATPYEDHDLQDALKLANKPDAISLSGTSSFMDQVTALDGKIKGDLDTYHFGATQADRDAAKAQLVGPDSTKLSELTDKVDQQTGFLSITPGISGPKIAALPDGDPQKDAYIKQGNDLINLVRGNGTLFADAGLLDSIAR